LCGRIGDATKAAGYLGLEDLAGRRQDELLIQPLAQTRLQRFHLLPNGGWRQMQLLHGQLETQMPRRGLERAERIKGWEDLGHRRPPCH
jgi:hypothetical protein